jgi:hypothetical protein
MKNASRHRKRLLLVYQRIYFCLSTIHSSSPFRAPLKKPWLNQHHLTYDRSLSDIFLRLSSIILQIVSNGIPDDGNFVPLDGATNPIQNYITNSIKLTKREINRREEGKNCFNYIKCMCINFLYFKYLYAMLDSGPNKQNWKLSALPYRRRL